MVDLSLFESTSPEEWVAEQLGSGSKYNQFWVAAHGTLGQGTTQVYRTAAGGGPHDAAQLAEKIRRPNRGWRNRPVKLWVCNAGTPRSGSDYSDTFACDLAKELDVEVIAYTGWMRWQGKGQAGNLPWGLPLEQGKEWKTFKASK